MLPKPWGRTVILRNGVLTTKKSLTVFILIPLLLLAARAGASQKAGRKMSKPSDARGRVALGAWGGRHVSLNVRADGASLEYDCARGTVDGPPDLDAEGRFDWKGTHLREGPGPIRLGRSPRSRPARYTGRVTGKEMSLTVTLTDTSQEVGTYKLARGSEGFIRKCR
jgi:hypothetical protein